MTQKIKEAAEKHANKIIGLTEMGMIAFKEKYKEPDFKILCETTFIHGANFMLEEEVRPLEIIAKDAVLAANKTLEAFTICDTKYVDANAKIAKLTEALERIANHKMTSIDKQYLLIQCEGYQAAASEALKSYSQYDEQTEELK